MAKRIKWSLIGIPDHQGVVHVGGRVGAMGGPAAFRRVFARLKGRDGVHDALVQSGDAAPLSSDLEANLESAAQLVAQAHSEHDFSIVVGGGHDHGYSHLLGISRALPKKARLGCINIDAHLDVRKPAPLITSGSPFYLALESKLLAPQRLIEFGIQDQCNGPELWQYVEKKKVTVVGFDRMRGGGAASLFKQSLDRLARICDAVVISLDLDAAAQAFAPGVSAPQAEGFRVFDIMDMAELAGRHKKVCSLGIFELNPEHDLDDRTARLAATAAYRFAAARLKLR